MKAFQRSLRAACSVAVGACFATLAHAADVTVHLSGASEVPPVTSSATGDATLSVGADGSVSGSIMTKGIDGTMAHIQQAAAGQNGPVIVKLVKDGESFKVPPGAKLDEAQMKAWKAGELYLNVHSAAHQGGEIRGQIK